MVQPSYYPSLAQLMPRPPWLRVAGTALPIMGTYLHDGLAHKARQYSRIVENCLSKRLDATDQWDNGIPAYRSSIVKRIALLFVVALGIAPLAQAQVYFNSGSAHPNNARAAERHLDRRASARGQMQRTVRCRDGSMHTPRVCRRHGGISR